MNKYQEAFETIAMIHGVDGLVSQFLDLKELVEKATPKKPDKYVLLERDYLGFPTHGYCKKCGTSLLVKNNYCGRCGQALDWGKDDGR